MPLRGRLLAKTQMQKAIGNVYLVDWLGLRTYKPKKKRKTEVNAASLKRDEVEAARKLVSKCLQDERDNDAAAQAQWNAAPNPWAALAGYTSTKARLQRKKLMDNINAARAAYALIRPKRAASTRVWEF